MQNRKRRPHPTLLGRSAANQTPIAEYNAPICRHSKLYVSHRQRRFSDKSTEKERQSPGAGRITQPGYVSRKEDLRRSLKENLRQHPRGHWKDLPRTVEALVFFTTAAGVPAGVKESRGALLVYKSNHGNAVFLFQLRHRPPTPGSRPGLTFGRDKYSRTASPALFASALARSPTKEARCENTKYTNTYARIPHAYRRPNAGKKKYTYNEKEYPNMSVWRNRRCKNPNHDSGQI